MKYGESLFDVLYLAFAIVAGIVLLVRSRTKVGKMMGYAALILGCGDAFHLLPRVLNYFVDADFTAALGIGKLVTSVTMTVFYVLLYFVWSEYFGAERNKNVTIAVFALAIVRIALCAFPQNGWLTNSGDVLWGIIRNIPFVILGAIVCLLLFKDRNKGGCLKRVWLYVLLSFLFYIPVAVAASLVPMLGMLMLPKTVCYILMIVCFLRSVAKENR